MRKLSEEDKAFVKKLNDFCGDIPCSLCDFLTKEFFTDCAVFFKDNQWKPAFYMKSELYDDPKMRKIKIQSFWNVLSLIRFLIDENYITVIPYTNQNKGDDHLLWKEWDRRTYINQNRKIYLQKPYWVQNGILYNDKNVCMKSIGLDEKYGDKIKGWLGDYYPLPRLSALIENDFQTEDEIRHAQTLKIAQDNLMEAKESVGQAQLSVKQAEESVKYAKRAIWVALGIGIISIIVNVLLARDNTMVIDKEQIESLLLHSQNGINKIHDMVTKEVLNVNVLNQLSKKDTFVVHVENQLSNTDTLNVRSIKAKSGTNSGNIVH